MALSDHLDSEGERASPAPARALEQLRLLVDSAPVAIVQWDREGRVTSWNPAAERIFGWPAAAVLGGPCPVVAGALSAAAMSLRDAALSGTPVEDQELLVECAGGAMAEVSISAAPVFDERHTVESVVVVAMDIAARRRRTRRLRHFATHDPLTDLLNRRAFEQSLARLIERGRRGGPGSAFLVIDLDLLKQVNDQLGHLAGDALLIAVANVLRGAVRPGDLLGRLGGDEFGVALERVGAAELELIAERLRRSIAAQRVGPHGRARSTASIGGALIDGTLDLSELLAQADSALYRAKERRDSSEISTPPYAPPTVRYGDGLAVNRLRRALAAGAVTVHFQPVRELAGAALHSLEALARLRLGGADRPAEEFIEIACDHGLIAAIDRRVLDLVLDRLGEAGPPLSLNLSAASLADPSVLEALRARVPRAGYAQRLILEFRANDLHSDPRRARRWTTAARALGAVIAVDDLGTDRSSFSALEGLPIGLAKLDRAVLASLAGPAGADRVHETARACASRGIAVAAKGIEDPDALDALLSVGVTLGQGFLLDEPRVSPLPGGR
jgi:diguanylate cyclase (GGDEF)-like protein/PAS domain S-box-containing protein